MSRHIGYTSTDIDEILILFMKTILNVQKNGLTNIPVKNTLKEPYKTFFDKCMAIFCDANPPEVALLLLNSECDVALLCKTLTANQALCFNLIKELCYHVYYDEDLYEYILSMCNILGRLANEYAHRTFFPNLPENIRKKHQLDFNYPNVPDDFFRLDDF